MPARATCIRMALSNFDPEQDEPIEHDIFHFPCNIIYITGYLGTAISMAL
jgi:hypothetical protein